MQKKRGGAFALIILLSSHSLVADDGALTAAKNSQDRLFSGGSVLVKTKKTNDTDQLNKQSKKFGAKISKKYTIIDGLYLIDLPPNRSVEEAIAFYNKLPMVEYVEPDYFASVVPVDDQETIRHEPGVEVTDPLFPNQWALENIGQSGGTIDADINAPESWLVETGSLDFVVGVIDSGVDYNHNDLTANLWQNSLEIPGNGIDDDGNGYIDDVYGINAITGSGDPLDDYLHGTHVTGAIGAVGDNSLGISGIMQVARVLNCKFLNSTGVGNSSDAIECMQYFANLKTRAFDPIDLVAINNSYVIAGQSQAFQDAIVQLRDLGVIFVAAAGNNSTNNDTTPRYPAGYPVTNIISVAASTRTDTLLAASNYGKLTVLLGAPGQSIQSTVPGQNYGYLSGTSNAAPYVTGLIGLLKSAFPGLTWASLKNLTIAGGEEIASLTTKTLSGRRIRGADLSGVGSLSCSGQIVKGRLAPLLSSLNIAVNSSLSLKALHINCENPNGDITLYNDGTTIVTLADGGVSGDDVAGDGVYSLDWTPTLAGNYTLDYGNGDTISIRVYDPATWKGYNINVDSTFTKETITGTSLGAGDETLSTLASPFPIKIGGDTIGFSTLYISSNGAISLTDAVLASGVNKSIPYTPPPAAATLLAPFWDDLTFSATGANIYYQTLGTAPNRKLVLEWRNFRHFNSTVGVGTFQVIFYEGSANIRYSYIDTDLGNSAYNSGKSATVGIYLPSGLHTQYSYLTPSVPSNRSLYLTLKP
jgi:subtilisin family serine protease